MKTERTLFKNKHGVQLSLSDAKQIFYTVVGTYPKKPEDFDERISFNIADTGISIRISVADIINQMRSSLAMTYLDKGEVNIAILFLGLDCYPVNRTKLIKARTIADILSLYQENYEVLEYTLYVVLRGRYHGLSEKDIRKIASALPEEMNEVEETLSHIQKKKQEIKKNKAKEKRERREKKKARKLAKFSTLHVYP